MKKTSFFMGVSIMTLALIVAVVGVTAAWFGDIMEYDRGPINVSSAQPTNDAIVVPDSSSDGSTGKYAKLAPARLKPGYQKSDINFSWKFGEISDLRNPKHSAIEQEAIPDTVSFSFVYSGAPANDDGITTRIKIELISVTLKNPNTTPDDLKQIWGEGEYTDADVERYLAGNFNYIENFAVDMFVTTDRDEVMIFTVPNTSNKYYTALTDDEGNDYYKLNDAHYIRNDDEPYTIYFDIVPVVHKLNATIWFITLDEETPPELIDAQLFLNFQVSFLANEVEEGGENNEG